MAQVAPPRLRVPGAPLHFEPHAFSRPRPNGRKRAPSGQRFHLWVSGCQMNESDADYLVDMREYEAFIRDLADEYETDPAQTGGAVLLHGLTAYIPVIFGCNEVCSFCIVPFVRGTERSRPMEDVLEDVRRFSAQGVREVTLLGQTVNSYRDPSNGARLSALLAVVERAPGIL